MEKSFTIKEASVLTTRSDDLKRFLTEDLGYGDLSSLVLPEDKVVSGRIFAKEECIVAGLEEAACLLGMVGVPTRELVNDGDRVGTGETVLECNGPVRGILAGERVALNVLSRMSGIASLVNDLVKKTRTINPDLRIACTRKTTPGFSFFQKKAVRIGGGDTHRFRLDDSIILKDNHLKCLKDLEEGLRSARNGGFTKKVEVEVESLADALVAAQAGADIVMLDNMIPVLARECYRTLKKDHPHVLVEVSGGIDSGNILDYAASADVISLGYLTHSYRSIDFSLELDIKWCFPEIFFSE